jgi:CTP-dependent riboflavin kinase
MSQWFSIEATVVRGHGVASGQGRTPYPAGSIAIQKPYFARLGLDLSGLYEGTLNLSIAPQRWRLLRATWTIPRLQWTDLHPPETFSFARCRVAGLDAWIYYPHPQTKAAHFQDASVIEVIAPKIEGVSRGDALTLELPASQIELLQEHA